MDLTHIEVSVPAGALAGLYSDLSRLITDCFGWSGTSAVVSHPKLGDCTERSYRMGRAMKLVLREAPTALQPGSDDHLGFSVGPTELDRLLARCLDLASSDPRVEFQFVEGDRPSEVDLGEAVLRTFFVRYLLPVWFQFECFQTKPPQG